MERAPAAEPDDSHGSSSTDDVSVTGDLVANTSDFVANTSDLVDITGDGPYDWYTRGVALLESGSPAAAEQLLARAALAEPTSRSVLEALGRAQFEARHYSRAKATFARIIDANPVDDYGHFALGLSAARIGDVRTAVEHLALAAAMRPDLDHYGRELRAARARLEGAP